MQKTSKGKIIAFTGSPRKSGHTNTLVREAVRGAKDAGFDVTLYDLASDSIKGCVGCYYCRTNPGCSVKDDLQPMFSDLKEAKAVIFGSPVYFYQITSQAKKGIDRLLPAVDITGSVIVPRFPGKKAISIFTQGNPDSKLFQSVFDWVNGIFKGLGWTVTKTIVNAGDSDQNSAEFKTRLKEAYEAGKALG